jgi:MoaA/NifB/PqqE/SkfB family radical SAM enzyme
MSVGEEDTGFEEKREHFQNTRRWRRILYLAGYYARFSHKSLGKLPVKEMLRTQFPFRLKDSPIPPALTIELTNYCNLRCLYCPSPLKPREQGFMSAETFSRLLEQIKTLGIYRVRLVGLGEPTLHPDFPRYVYALAGTVPVFSVTTNGQWVKGEMPGVMGDSAIDLVNISVDGTTREEYEHWRVGGDFDRLLSNLTRLREAKRRARSHVLINIRLMLHPSQRDRERNMVRFWHAFGDVVQKQYVLDFVGGPRDQYQPVSEGRCTLPFKTIDVRWNGDVPLCPYSQYQTGQPAGLLLGNINEATLDAMWNSETMRQYREGHRHRKEDLIPLCKGCPGRT